MASTTRLMTFAEFERLPEPAFGKYELRQGEPFLVAPPKNRHFLIQQMLRDLLDRAAAGRGRVYTETGFLPGPEYEYILADVVYMSEGQLPKLRNEEYFRGVPELVIEILSPSNTPEEMARKQKLCLQGSSHQFWIVDDKRREIKVSTPAGDLNYKSGDLIPLFFAPGKTVAVEAIFA